MMPLRTALAAVLALALAAPPAAQIMVYGDLARDRDVAPGETYEEVVQVHNPTDAPQQARIYLRDYAFAADGSNVYGEPGSLERSNAGWITFAPPVLTVPPGATVPVAVTVAVPSDGLTGSYWSMLMIEGVPEGSAESTLGEDEGPADEVRFQVTERIRYGVQIASHLAEGAAAAEVVGVQLLADDAGARQFTADVTNAGDRMFAGPVYLDVFGADGASLGRIEGSHARVYPGTSVRHRVDLTALAPGVYEALLVIDGGDEGLFGAQYTLEL